MSDNKQNERLPPPPRPEDEYLGSWTGAEIAAWEADWRLSLEQVASERPALLAEAEAARLAGLMPIEQAAAEQFEKIEELRRSLTEQFTQEMRRHDRLPKARRRTNEAQLRLFVDSVEEEVDRAARVLAPTSAFIVRLLASVTAVVQPKRRSSIETPPCMQLDRFARFVFSKRTYETVFNPCIIETQAEYIKSLADGDLRKAQWIGHRGVIAFWATLLKQLPIVRQIWTLSRG